MQSLVSRRKFISVCSTGLAASAIHGIQTSAAEAPKTSEPEKKLLFKISLAEWSLHRAIFSGQLANIDFPKAARSYGIDAVEFVNTCFFARPWEAKYAREQLPKDIKEMRTRCNDLGVQPLLIMCDRLGLLGDPDAGARADTFESHKPWVEAAKKLGCHSLRVNAHSRDVSFGEQMKYSIEGVGRLVRWAAKLDMNILLENHNELTSHAGWLAGVIKGVDHERLGSLPDFGNFTYAPGKHYDRYKGVAELMPWAKAVSAKSYDFDEHGQETTIDYKRIIKPVLAAGYRGHISIEYEGERLSEPDGIRATKKLLEQVRDQLAEDT